MTWTFSAGTVIFVSHHIFKQFFFSLNNKFPRFLFSSSDSDNGAENARAPNADANQNQNAPVAAAAAAPAANGANDRAVLNPVSFIFPFFIISSPAELYFYSLILWTLDTTRAGTVLCLFTIFYALSTFQ